MRDCRVSNALFGIYLREADGATVEVFGPTSRFNRHLAHPVAGLRVADLEGAVQELLDAGVEIVLPDGSVVTCGGPCEDNPGFDLVRPVSVMGHDKGPGHCEIRYTDCRVPEGNLSDAIRKLDAFGPPLIHTIRLVGYTLRESEV